MSKCSVTGCLNSKPHNPDKYFFFAPRPGEKRELWTKALNKSYKASSRFLVCEDHFDLSTDVDCYKLNGIPMLKKLAYPHRNLEEDDIKLQAKIDKLNWSCFVPKCESKRRPMTDKNKKVIFFPVPAGEERMLWESVVNVDQIYSRRSSDEPLFCCEEHFDVNKDIQKIFHCDGSIEYKVRTGIVPSFQINESNESKQSRLGDSTAHPKMIRNNHLATFYSSKLMLIVEKQQMYLDDVKDIKNEPDDSVTVSYMKVGNAVNDEPYIKTEPIDDESNCRLIIERQEVYYDPEKSYKDLNLETGIKAELMDVSCDGESNSKLVIEEQDVESECESSVASYKENLKDPDVSFDDFSSDTDDATSSSASDESDDEYALETSDEDSDLDTAERFECPHCKKFVKKLEAHVERTHGNYAKKINKTICGLCLKKFPYKGNLKDHQKEFHNGNAYACDLCDFMTPWFQIIRKHVIDIHLQEKYFLCQFCGKSFKNERNLQHHTEVLHSDNRERRYACDMCDKKYYHSSTLKEHINAIHLKERKFHCKVDGCNKTFSRKNNFRTHQRVHNPNLFSCFICEKKFTFKCNLQTHIKNIHRAT